MIELLKSGETPILLLFVHHHHHHRHYSANFDKRCHLTSIPFQMDYMSTALTSLPLVNVIGPRLANTRESHRSRHTANAQFCRPEGWCREAAGAKVFRDILWLFFWIWPPLHPNISPKMIVCITSMNATFPISSVCPTVLYQKQHSHSTPPSSQFLNPQMPFKIWDYGRKMTIWYVR